MNTIVTMTLDEAKKYQLTEDEIKLMKEHREHIEKEEYDEDCPPLSKEELKKFKPWYQVKHKNFIH